MVGQELLEELAKNGYKYTEKEIIFITRDNTGKLIWLEWGNANAGLDHIIQRHREQFSSALGIAEKDIAAYLYNVITYGKMIKTSESKVQGGMDRVYEYVGNYFTFTGMGSNGFIVTAFPVSK